MPKPEWGSSFVVGPEETMAVHGGAMPEPGFFLCSPLLSNVF